VAAGFLVYKRSQFSDLLQENIDLKWEHENLKVNYDYTVGLLESCKGEKSIEKEIGTNPDVTNPIE